MTTKKTLLLSALLLSNYSLAQAQSLQKVLRYALVSDPILLEAEADMQGAYNKVEQAKSAHWPTVKVTGNQMITQHHKNSADNKSNGFNPGVEVAMNIYSFGAIDSEIKKSQSTEEYFGHKKNESREELGLTVGKLYLDALRAKEAIRILNGSLARHNRILKDLSVVVEYDEGRSSEFVQAQARKILVEQRINEQQRILDTSLSSLSKYTQTPAKEAQITLPFKGLTESVLKQKYSIKAVEENPSYRAQKAEFDSKLHDMEAEKAKRMPSINLIGTANKDDQQVYLNVSWDLFNRASEYTVGEKASLLDAAKRRLSRVSRDADEMSRLALINIQQNTRQLKTLKAQIQANKKVVDFYSLQFTIARKTLLEVLNAESELSDVELAYANTQSNLYEAILSYLRSQGKISTWAGVPTADNNSTDSESK